jgi:hypothetical protein
MWAIEYSDEVKLYFIDNGDLVFALLVRIEELRYLSDAIPPEGCTQLEPNVFMWDVLHHTVVYRKSEQTLVIAIVKPID